ncbi:LacI family DNA-binding transcriptional regulator [Symbiopectobacterium sp. Eva_TO]
MYDYGKKAQKNPVDAEKLDGGSRRIRLEDIAARCGTSLSTVSRALSGEKGVSQALRAQILEVARAVRYNPAVEMGGSRIVLAVSQVAMLDYHRYQFSWYVLQGLKERAKVLVLDLVTHPLSDKGTQALTDLLNQDDIGGMLALTVDDPAILDVVVNLKKPAVLVNSEDPLMRLSSVMPCNRSATRMAADYLVSHGHRDILFLTHPGRRTIEQRHEGWQESMRYFQLPCSELQVISVTDWLPELAEQAVVSWFREKKRTCTAILCANDSLALGVLAQT